MRARSSNGPCELHFLVQNTESPTHDRSVAALGIPSVWPLAIRRGCFLDALASRAQRAPLPVPPSTPHVDLLPSTQHPHPPTRVLGRHCQVTKPSSEPGRNGRDGICGTGRPTGIQDPGKDWESRAARVMYFCTRLPKPNSYRSHQLSPEIPTPLAPAEASCLVLANGHRLAALRRRVEGPN